MAAQGRKRTADEDQEERVRRLEERVEALEAALARHGGAPRPSWHVVKEPAPRPAPTKPPRESRSLEELVGGNLLPKLGVVVLVLGVAFFLKFAFDAGLIGLTARIIMGVVGGAALAGLGEWLWRRGHSTPVYAQILVAGGMVVIYFSIFAAYAFEEYRDATGMSLELASLLLALISLGAAAYAWWREAQSFAGVSVGLVLWTLLTAMEWTGFSLIYVVAASVALNAVAAHRSWPYVPYAVLLPAYLGLFLHLDSGATRVGLAFATCAVYATFVAHALVAPRDRPWGQTTPLQGLATFLTWLVWVFLIDLFLEMDGAAWVTLGMAIVAGGLAFVPSATRGARIAWGALSMIGFYLWPYLHFEPVVTAWVWIALTAAALGAAIWRRGVWAEAGLMGGALLVAFHLFTTEAVELAQDTLRPGVAGALFGAAFLVTAAAWWVVRRDRPLGHGSPALMLTSAVALPVVYFGVWLEREAIAIAWAVFASLLVTLGFTMRIVELRYAAFAVFGLVLVRILVDVWRLDPLFRVIVFLVVGALLLAVSYLFARRRGGLRIEPGEERPRPERGQGKR